MKITISNDKYVLFEKFPKAQFSETLTFKTIIISKLPLCSMKIPVKKI